ncbi:MAG: sulfatase-like hydrolase/transferase [Tannerella sp.]|nr:sulfatase-like hydrolase/transferase [Tannerella sp.]
MTHPLLASRKWAFLLIFFILLLNPLFYFWAEDVHLKDKCFAWITCIVAGAALSVIDLFCKRRGEKIYLTMLFLLSCVPNFVVWSYLYLSRLYMKRDMFWVIFNSYSSEAKEYVHQFIPWQLALAGFLYIGFCIFCIVKTHSSHAVSIKQRRTLFFSAVCIIIACIGFQYLSQAIPTIEFYKSHLLFRMENRIFQKEKELRRQLTMEVKCVLPDSVNHVFVILLGESTTTCHMSLYGYFRKTTPLMDRRAHELDVYTDVVTPDTHTYGVMQKVLTFANHQHPEYYMEKASVVELFNAAGFESYWIANNPILDKWGASYGVIAQQAHHVFDVSFAKKPDEIVLTSLRRILDDKEKGNKVIFIHLMGNHHAYRSRYPDLFEYFNYEKDRDLADLGFRNDEMKATIDAYDNSVLYGDYVYDSILRELEKSDASSYLLFFSDHGEEVYDTRNASGHHLSNIYPCQCKIPFVLWRSESYEQENAAIDIDTKRPYSIENVIYSISTLSGLEYQDNNPSLSVFSPKYVASEKRMVGKENYTEILKKIQKTKNLLSSCVFVHP